MKEIMAGVTDVVVKKLGVEESQVTPEASFTKDLGADSLDTVELVMEFEKVFDITIEEEDQTKVQTVGQVVQYIKEKKG
ncbi:MAG: acyl carrier protein [Ignavibacteria bacterium]|nr:acyl carrier protein [Ignavibacteria bacterium]